MAGSSRGGARPTGRLVIVLGLAVQVGVPVAASLGEPPSRFGWQMYSGLGEVPSIKVYESDGKNRSVAFDDVTGASRAELDWKKHLPPYLCNTYPAATTVELEYTEDVEHFKCEEVDE